MRRLTVALALLVAASAVGACGIGPGPVVTHSKVQPEDQVNPFSTDNLKRPDNLQDEVDLVNRYLRAAADKPDTQLQTLRSYMVDPSWKPDGESVNIYRILDEPVAQGQVGNTKPVSVAAQRVGTLKDGRIDPVFEERTLLQFRVIGSGPTGALIDEAPKGLILNDAVLRNRLRPVYFWDNEDERLVPDLRYIPDGLEEEKADQLVKYLGNGPSAFLAKAVKPVPQGQVQLRIKPVHNPDGSMTIDLRDQLGQDDLARLAAQLKQTLVRGGGVTGIQLKIQGVLVQPAILQPVEDSGPAARFGVKQQKVVRLDFGPDKSAVPLSPEINTAVEWAVFSRREEAVAMSRIVNGAKQFLIGPSSAPKPVSVGGGKPVDQAAWLNGASRAALVLSDRKLYEVKPGSEPKPLSVPVSGQVTGFSVVPDGRIALVIDRKLYMAALYHNGDALTITQPQQVPTALDQVQHVALGRLDAIIAGIGLDDKQTKLVVTQINVDGLQQLQAWADYGVGEQISRLVTDFRSGVTYYDYKDVAQLVSQGGANAVRESPTTPQSSPSAGPSASPAPPPPPINAVSFEG